jgi:signal transduction histidine kinase
VKPCGVEAILQVLDRSRAQRRSRGRETATETAAARKEGRSDAGATTEDRRSASGLRRTGQFLREFVHDARTAAFPLQIQLHLLENSDRAPASAETATLLKDYLAMCETLHGVLRRTGMLLRQEPDSDPAVLDLQDVINCAVAEFQQRCAAQDIRVNLELTAPDVRVRGDRDSLVQALAELLDNAAEASPPGGCLRIQLRSDEGRASIAVRDEGPGIPADQVERALEPFERLGRKCECLSGRVGLGLAIADRIAALHEGRLSIRAGETGGCAALIELPVAAE